jgi:hypothetical protein
MEEVEKAFASSSPCGSEIKMGMLFISLLNYANSQLKGSQIRHFFLRLHGKECAGATSAQLSEEKDNVRNGFSVARESQQGNGQFKEFPVLIGSGKCFGPHLRGTGVRKWWQWKVTRHLKEEE